MRDPYSTLGVDRGADADAIRKQYRKLAKELHPDVNKDPRAVERFKEVNGAYDILSDDEKRRAWDEFGEASTRPGFDAEQARAYRSTGGGFGFNGGGGFPGGGQTDVDDLLSSLFGGAQGRAGPRRGADQQLDLRIDFLMAVTGGERHVTLRRPDGTTESLRIPIPAGARDGGKIRLRGQGAPPRGGGPCGDLVVVLEVADHPLLRRAGDDLELDVPITVLEALRGGAVTVPTPTGEVKVTIPEGARNGTRLRLKGRGVQKRGTAGDLYLVLRPTVPASSDPEVIAAAERIEEAYEDVRGALKL